MDLLCTESVPADNELQAAAPDPVLLRRRVLDNLLRAEERYAPHGSYFGTVQRDLTPQMRRLVADWMLEVCEDQNCQEEVFPLAMSYLDRFLATCTISRNQLQLLGAACLLLASKLREPSENGFKADVLVFYTANSITRNDLCSWELLVLSKLKWDMATVTPHEFLPLLISRLNVPAPANPVMITRHAQTLIALAARDYEFSMYSASTLASSSIAAAFRGLGLNGQLELLHRLTNVDQDCLQTCLEQLEEMVRSTIAERSIDPNGLVVPEQHHTSHQVNHKDHSNAATPTDVRDVHF